MGWWFVQRSWLTDVLFEMVRCYIATMRKLPGTGIGLWFAFLFTRISNGIKVEVVNVIKCNVLVDGVGVQSVRKF
jgi:hypothetical protein